jgi:predicted DNA-binding protein
VTFRLSDPQFEELRALARRAGLGSSALARRIIEHYIAAHARRARRGRK